MPALHTTLLGSIDSIEDEREALKGHIEQLKTSLEDAQLSRRQMIEYDLIAEKINQLPSRDELQQ